MNGKIIIPKRFYYIIFATVVAIWLISFTVGREWYADKTESIYSFALIHFSGYLFFLLMPVEVAFVYYLPFYSEIEMMAMALGTAVAAQIIDYLIGNLIRPRQILDMMGEKRIAKAQKQIDRYGLLTIFVFNLLPLSSPVIALVAGMIKFNFRKYFVVSFIGLFLKYFILALFFA